MHPCFVVSVGHYLSSTGHRSLHCGSAEYSDSVFSSSLWVVLSGFEKTSVVKRSSIPLSPGTTIITLGLSTGDHPPVERRWLADSVGGGCGAVLTSIHIHTWNGKQEGTEDGERQITSVFFLFKTHWLSSYCSCHVNKVFLTSAKLSKTGVNACAYEWFLKLNRLQGNSWQRKPLKATWNGWGGGRGWQADNSRAWQGKSEGDMGESRGPWQQDSCDRMRNISPRVRHKT